MGYRSPTARRTADGAVGASPLYETAARVARDLEENHVRDRDAERPAPSEMAEKLRRARSAGFHDFEPEPHAARRAARRAPARADAAERTAGGEDPRARRPGRGRRRRLAPGLHAPRLDRAPPVRPARGARRARSRAAPTLPLDAETHAPSDAEAWIAFAAAAVRRSDDAEEGAEIADQLLAEYRKRRARGGVLGGEV